MAKLIYVDTETGGTDEKIHALLELAGIIEIDDKIVEKFHFKLRPFENDIIEDDALKITGFTREEIATWEDPRVVYKKFTDMMFNYVDRYDKRDKFALVGFNGIFDDAFLREFFKKNNDKYYGSAISYPPLDVAVLAGIKLMSVRNTMENFRLMTVAKQLGINIDETKAHGAMYDIAVTYKAFKILLKG